MAAPKEKKPRKPKIIKTDNLFLDAYQNLMARQGVDTNSFTEGAEYPLQRLTRDYQLMNSLYRNSWIIRKVINVVPQDMMRQGIEIQTEASPEDISKIEATMKQTRVNQGILRGLSLGRLFGGAAALMMIEGQEDELEQPLNMDSIMPGDFKGLMVVDRWSGIYPDLELVEDISDPEFGLPKYYQFRDITSGASFTVHHSRILRFIGHDLPDWERQVETYWGISVVEPIFEELKKRDGSSASIAGLIFQSRLKILKMGDFGSFLGTSTPAQQKQLYSMLAAQSSLQSSSGVQIVDKDSDMTSLDYTFTGLNEIYQSFMLDMCGATGIPATKLFGRAPAGMNSTGESDARNYYDMVECEQQEHLRPVYDKLLPIIAMSTLGTVPENFDFLFNPLETPSEKEVGDIVKSKMDSLNAVFDRGVISNQTYLQEARTIGSNFGMFTNITDDIINSADTDLPEPFAEAEPIDATE